jgi:hypothetical protein
MLDRASASCQVRQKASRLGCRLFRTLLLGLLFLVALPLTASLPAVATRSTTVATATARQTQHLPLNSTTQPKQNAAPPKKLASTNGALQAQQTTSPPRSTSAADRTEPIPRWVGTLLAIVGVAILGLLLWILTGAPGRGRMQSGAGPALLATLPVLAALALIIIPFAPDLGGGKWIVVDSIAVAILVAGGFVGFLYGLPVVDADAVKAAGTAAGTFTRPSTKLDNVIDNLMPAITGGVFTVALTQAGNFSAFFVHFMGLPPNSASNFFGLGILAFFSPIGFILGYSLTATVGALAFKRAEESLVNEVTLVDAFPPFPDLPVQPTDEQRCAALAIAARPYRSLSGAMEKASWARAQSLLAHWPDALRAFQDATELDPRNPDLLLDYAVTIYNDPDVDDIPRVLNLLDKAQSMLGAQATPLQQRRMRALRAVATLYQPNGYEDTIAIVNDWIKSNIPVSRFGRFYRACAFGQLYDSCAPTPLPAAPPYVLLDPSDFAALKTLIDNDIAVTLVVAPDTGRDNVRMTIDPTSPLRIPPSDDDDLQLWAIADPALCAMVGLSATPPPPTTPRPAAPMKLPNPITAAPGVLAAWIAQNCPT